MVPLMAALLLGLAPSPGRAEPAAHPFELALDIGEEFGEHAAPTTGLLFAWEFVAHNRLIATTAFTYAVGGHSRAVEFGGGYYHAWELWGFEPELGVELGAIEEHGWLGYGRAGAGLLHGIGERFFAGVVSDVAYTTTEHVIGRVLLELGAKL